MEKLQLRYQTFYLLTNLTHIFYLCHRKYQIFKKLSSRIQNDGYGLFDLQNFQFTPEIKDLTIFPK